MREFLKSYLYDFRQFGVKSSEFGVTTKTAHQFGVGVPACGSPEFGVTSESNKEIRIINSLICFEFRFATSAPNNSIECIRICFSTKLQEPGCELVSIGSFGAFTPNSELNTPNCLRQAGKDCIQSSESAEKFSNIISCLF
jgi:hypothetical protein